MCYEQLNEEEMKARLLDIKVEEEKLAQERHRYEEYFRKQSEQIKIAEYKKYEGRYFEMLKMNTSYRNKDVRAFKVIQTYEDRPNYALCKVIVDNSKLTGESLEYGIVYKEIGLWLPWLMTLKHMENSMKVIDLYREISEDEFKQIQSEVISKLIEEV